MSLQCILNNVNMERCSSAMSTNIQRAVGEIHLCLKDVYEDDAVDRSTRYEREVSVSPYKNICPLERCFRNG